MTNQRLIVFEGLNGSGKTSQARRLMQRLRQSGLRVVLHKEPSWSYFGRLAKYAEGLDPWVETGLYMADRAAQAGIQDYTPCDIAIQDRYYYSTMAYQGAKGVDIQVIYQLHQAWALRPDLLIYLDLEPDLSIKRQDRHRHSEFTRSAGYLERVREIYRSMSTMPGWVEIDASENELEVERQVWAQAVLSLGLENLG